MHAQEINIHILIFFPCCHYPSSPLPSHFWDVFDTEEPKVYVSAGPTALLDGGDETLVAACIAERGRPAAEVFWETELHGRSDSQTQDEPNGTSTTHVRYMWRPQSSAQGKTLTCVVRHPALPTEFRIPYILNVQCE